MQDAQLISQAGLVESLASDGLVSVSTGAGQPQKNMELAKFADSLGSSVPLQQTSEQVSITGLYARTSDGKMVELTKESVASILGNLLYGADTLAELSSGVAEQMGAPMMWETTSRLASIKTPIPVNGGNGVYAYVYMISYNWSSGDATFYEYGIIRIGHSENYVSKNIISEHKRDGTSFSVSSDSDGYVTINTTSSPMPNLHIRIMG